MFPPFLASPATQSSSDGALSHPGLPEALVDGGDSGAWKSAVLGGAAGVGLPAHHAEKGRLLLPPVHRYNQQPATWPWYVFVLFVSSSQPQV